MRTPHWVTHQGSMAQAHGAGALGCRRVWLTAKSLTRLETQTRKAGTARQGLTLSRRPIPLHVPILSSQRIGRAQGGANSSTRAQEHRSAFRDPDAVLVLSHLQTCEAPGATATRPKSAITENNGIPSASSTCVCVCARARTCTCKLSEAGRVRQTGPHQLLM